MRERLLNSSLFRQSFFRKHAPSEKGPYGISSEVMDTYVKSCGELLLFFFFLYLLIPTLLNNPHLLLHLQPATASSHTSWEWETDIWTTCC